MQKSGASLLRLENDVAKLFRDDAPILNPVSFLWSLPHV